MDKAIGAVAMLLVSVAIADSRPVTVTQVSMQELQRVCKGAAYGCAYWRDRSKPCRVYMPYIGDALLGYAVNTEEIYRETLQHELEHCTQGVTHPE